MPEFNVLFEDLGELLETIIIQLPWLFVIWLTFVGGAIGSFLNVVVYRMPAGLSISHPPSRCPKCEKHIGARDNIPVLSWLVLGGKCRHCHLPISARYPVVEATVAGIFALIAWATVVATSSSVDVPIGFARFVYYANSASCLFTLGLIDFDSHRIPRRLFFYAFLSIAVPPVIWPELRVSLPLGWMNESCPPHVASGATIILHSILGVSVSLVISWAFARTHSLVNLLQTGALSGIVAGWWVAILSIVILALIVHRVPMRAPFVPSYRRQLKCSPCLTLGILTIVALIVQLFTRSH